MLLICPKKKKYKTKKIQNKKNTKQKNTKQKNTKHKKYLLLLIEQLPFLLLFFLFFFFLYFFLFVFLIEHPVLFLQRCSIFYDCCCYCCCWCHSTPYYLNYIVVIYHLLEPMYSWFLPLLLLLLGWLCWSWRRWRRRSWSCWFGGKGWCWGSCWCTWCWGVGKYITSITSIIKQTWGKRVVKL